MRKTVDSIREYGVLVPVIIRPDGNGEYEMISGHRRRYASIMAGKKEVPAIIREMDDDTATILMVDSNLQREHILPSERAKAYKMKMEALKHQGKRTDLKLCDPGKNQISMQSLFILGSASCKTEIVFDVVDISFDNSPDFIGIIPFFGTAYRTGISTQIFFRIDINHTTTS